MKKLILCFQQFINHRTKQIFNKAVDFLNVHDFRRERPLRLLGSRSEKLNSVREDEIN